MDYDDYLNDLLVSHLKIKNVVNIITNYKYKVPEHFVNKMNKKVKYHQTKPLGNVFENKLRVFDVVCDFLLDETIVQTHELKSFYDSLKNSSNPKSYLKHNNFEVLFLIKKHILKNTNYKKI